MTSHFTLVLAFSLLAIACGGSEDEPSTEPPSSATRPAEGVFGIAPGPTGGVPSVVTLTPAKNGAISVLGAPTPGLIDQFGLSFSPTLRLARAGHPVIFTNSEAALTHNVTVRELARDSTIFTGDAGSGDSLEVVLPAVGGYDVLCEMHPGMTAFIYATDTPYATFSDDDGSFTIVDVPPGEYMLHVWSVDETARSEQAVTVGPGATEVEIAVVR